MTQQNAMTLAKLNMELEQIFGKPEYVRQGEHKKFESETLEFYVNNSIQMIMQFIDENYTRHGIAFPGVSGEQFVDLALFIREAQRYISLGLYKNEKGMRFAVAQAKREKNYQLLFMINLSADQSRYHFINKFVQLVEITGVIPDGKFVQPVTEALLAIFDGKKKRGESLTRQDKELLEQYRLLCKHAYDKLMSLRVFASEFPEAMSIRDRKEAAEIARALGDPQVANELEKGIFLMHPPRDTE